jgi:hypothetical protein
VREEIVAQIFEHQLFETNRMNCEKEAEDPLDRESRQKEETNLGESVPRIAGGKPPRGPGMNLRAQLADRVCPGGWCGGRLNRIEEKIGEGKDRAQRHSAHQSKEQRQQENSSEKSAVAENAPQEAAFRSGNHGREGYWIRHGAKRNPRRGATLGGRR